MEIRVTGERASAAGGLAAFDAIIPPCPAGPDGPCARAPVRMGLSGRRAGDYSVRVQRLWIVLRVLFAVALLGFVFSRVDPGAALDVVARAPAWAFAVPVALLFANSLLHAARLRLLVPSDGPGVPTLLRIALLGNFFGLFLPSGGGEAAKVVALAPHVGGLERGFAVLGAARLMELVPWAFFLVWGALAVLPGHLPGFVPLAWGAAAGMLAAALGGAVALRYGEVAARRLPGPIALRVRRIASLSVPSLRVLACLLLAVPFAALNVTVVWVILVAYGAPLSLATVFGVVPAADVLISLPITVAGVGVREGLFVHAFAAWGVAEPVALAVAFTRWSAELGRAAAGAVFFALGRHRRRSVTGGTGVVR